MVNNGASDSHPLRRRVVEWSDPALLAQASCSRDGLAFLRAMMAGELPPPPLIALLGIDLLSADPGRVTMRIMPGEYHYNPLGSVHGGVIASLLDSAMGCAVHSRLPLGCSFTNIEIKVNYLRSVTALSGPITAIGEVVHAGRWQAMAEAKLLDQADRLCATASTTCILLDAPAREQAKPVSPDPTLAAQPQTS